MDRHFFLPEKNKFNIRNCNNTYVVDELGIMRKASSSWASFKLSDKLSTEC
ncbi:MAG: hypothetical protein GY750_18090 [Lentisphaerae bacterium]|nr:hypothetical protein [Lentisphaerota bacterium]MCP4103309.1 hypothetical protein [Lentisphaerota bacterium]